MSNERYYLSKYLQNIFAQSDTIDTDLAYWTLGSGATRVAGNLPDPLGTNKAVRYRSNGPGGAFVVQTNTIIGGEPYYYNAWFRVGTGTITTGKFLNAFNLYYLAANSYITNSWQLLSLNFTADVSTIVPFYIWSDVDTDVEIEVFGAHLTHGSAYKPYTATFTDRLLDESDFVEVFPEYDFKDSATKIENRHRSRSGNEYVYKWGEFSKKSMSVSFVDSEFRCLVNSWWSNNDSLMWVSDADYNVSHVRLVNKSQPIDSLVKPYSDLFSGAIELETY